MKRLKNQVAAMKGYQNANTVALRLWEEVYMDRQAPLIALTDTFTTGAFIKVSRSYCNL